MEGGGQKEAEGGEKINSTVFEMVMGNHCFVFT